MSIAFANLPTHLRYRARNLQVYGITPGPKEFNTEELAFFMKCLVDDLIRLYEEGIIVKTKDYPDGDYHGSFLCPWSVLSNCKT